MLFLAYSAVDSFLDFQQLRTEEVQNRNSGICNEVEYIPIFLLSTSQCKFAKFLAKLKLDGLYHKMHEARGFTVRKTTSQKNSVGIQASVTAKQLALWGISLPFILHLLDLLQYTGSEYKLFRICELVEVKSSPFLIKLQWQSYLYIELLAAVKHLIVSKSPVS